MNEELFDDLIASVREGGAILRGEAHPARSTVVEVPDVAQIRAGLQLSQSQFAALLGISVAALRDWEQGRRISEGPARILLQVAARHPEVVRDAARGVGREPASTAARKKIGG